MNNNSVKYRGAFPGPRLELSGQALSGPATRQGFSLLEILLATAILFGAAIVLFELAAIGREHVNSAEELAVAQHLCETRINEILAGAAAPKAVENEEVLEQSGWKLTVEINPVDGQAGLAALRVTVFREADEMHRGKQYSLVRWIRDPHQGESSLPDSWPADSSAPPVAEMPPEPGAEP